MVSSQAGEPHAVPIILVPIILGTTATDAATALSLGDAGLHADNFILLETFA